MKKYYVVITAVVLSLLLGACATTNDNGNQDNNNDIVTDDGETNNNNTNSNDNNSNATNDDSEETNADEHVQKMENLEYTKFELDVSYENDQDYEVDLKLKTEENRVKAKLEDDEKGIKIEGAGAFDEVYSLVEQVTIDQDTSKENAIAQILEAFDISSDYKEFELELKFKDGTKKEYKDNK